MPRRETPAADYVPPMTPSNVITYCRVLVDYTGTQVRSILNSHVSTSDTEFALSHVQGPMAYNVQSTWRQYLRRVATYTCLCFGLANAREIGEASYPYSHMEWLRIYNAATKRGGLVYQNYYLSVGSMTVMVEKNDDARATDRSYDKWKRGLMSGIGGTIVDKPMVRKEKDELAGKFRFGKTILITDLNYKCQANSGGTTNIQYGLDEMGYVVTVIDINSFKSVTRAQKFLDAVEHLIKDVMPDIAAEENMTIHFWILHSSSRTLIHTMFGLRGTMQRGSLKQSEGLTNWRQDQSLCRSARIQGFMVSDQAFRKSLSTQLTS